MYIQIVFENVVVNVVNDPNLCHLSLIYFAVSQAIDTVATIVIKKWIPLPLSYLL